MTLIEGIQKDLERISKTVDDLKRASDEPGVNQAAALAQYLSLFYTGVENCLEKLLKLTQINLPREGEHYPTQLLRLVADSKFIPTHGSELLLELLAFRDFVWGSYGTHYDLDEVKDKAARTQQAWPDLKSHFQSILQQVAPSQ